MYRLVESILSLLCAEKCSSLAEQEVGHAV